MVFRILKTETCVVNSYILHRQFIEIYLIIYIFKQYAYALIYRGSEGPCHDVYIFLNLLPPKIDCSFYTYKYNDVVLFKFNLN